MTTHTHTHTQRERERCDYYICAIRTRTRIAEACVHKSLSSPDPLPPPLPPFGSCPSVGAPDSVGDTVGLTEISAGDAAD